MKKNWTQIATLCLCAVLLVVTIVQGNKLNELQQSMETQMRNLRSDVEREIQNISSNIERELEEANRLVAKYALEPNGIDPDARSLKAVAAVTLKEWHEDTEVLLVGKIGDEELFLTMTNDGNGEYSCPLLLPIGEKGEIFLDVTISSGGLTKKESLGGWGDMTMLLPLRNGGGGWSGPEYREGIMSSQFNITIDGQDGPPAPVANPQFLTYKNGELVQTQNAIVDPYSGSSNGICYTVDTEDMNWSVECAVGDKIEIRFRCEDEYGLGYDFLFANWVAEGETAENQASAGGANGGALLELYWPE